MSITDSRDRTNTLTGMKSLEAMEGTHMEILGRQFRIVENGLDPDEVIEFIKTAAGSSEDAFRRLEQFSALQAAARTMEGSIEQARRLAEHAKKQAEKEAEQRKARVAEETRQQAVAIIDQVQKGCMTSVDGTYDVVLCAIQQAFDKARETVSENLKQMHEDIKNAAESSSQKWRASLEQPVEQTAKPQDVRNDAALDDKEKENKSPEEVIPSLVNIPDDWKGLRRNDSQPEIMKKTGEPTTEKHESPVNQTADDNGPIENVDGNVVVVIPRGVKETWMHQFRSRISQAPGMHVQGESEGDQERVEVTLSVDDPAELLPLLQDLPNVRKVMESWNGKGQTQGQDSGEAHPGSVKSGNVALILQFA